MSILFNKVAVSIDLDAIRHNFRLLTKGSSAPICVIKADAYGHGLVPVAEALADEGATRFAVGTVEEAAYLRQSGTGREILSLLGPVDPADYDLLWTHDISPAVHSFAILRELVARSAGQNKKLNICLKFDTGMHRLGFRPEQAYEAGQLLAQAPGLVVDMAFSHLARADEDSGQEFVSAQLEAFLYACEQLERSGHHPKRHLANSAGILGYENCHLDACRPGIALYGANPFANTRFAELGKLLRPAMSVSTSLVSVHELRLGEGISYGGTFTAPKDMTVGIIAAGYADAYSRGLSGKAQVCLHGRRTPVLGRVCMQLAAIDLTGLEQAQPGERVHLLGGQGDAAISPEELAGWWGTIPYEVFCLLGLNRREYVSTR